MMPDFKYDILDLIRNVRDRPCLWNKLLDSYKDKNERKNAWQEIFHELEENYDELTPEEQSILGEAIMSKWIHTRDHFNRSLKIKPGKVTRKYFLHDHLIFLKDFHEDHTYSNADSIPDEQLTSTTQKIKKVKRIRQRKKKPDCVDYNVEFVTKQCKSESETSEHNASEEVNNDALEEVNNVSFVGMDSDTSTRMMNEDEAFFASLLPTVVNYNEDERLQFRIEVLSVMKRIRDKRNELLLGH